MAGIIPQFMAMLNEDNDEQPLETTRYQTFKDNSWPPPILDTWHKIDLSLAA